MKGALAAVPALNVTRLTGNSAGPLGPGSKSWRKKEAAKTNGKEAVQLNPIELLKPEKSGGKPVMEALWLRRTNRKLKPDPLAPQVLSNLLWAAFGINRPEGSMLRGKPGRTAASASNSQEIDLYVAMPDGVYIYEAGPHRLAPVVAGDFRHRAGRRQGGANAPLRIFFVVDLSRYVLEGQPDPRIKEPEVQKSYYYVATGLIAQNIYLYAAATGLGAWFHNCDRENTPAEFKLRPEQKVLFAMTVGHPA